MAAEPMRVLGIDPGSRRTGWGVLSVEGTRLRFIATDTIVAGDKRPLEERLLRIHEGLAAAIAEHRPTTVAVEDLFFAKHANAALKLGHARGVALLAAAQAGLEVSAYPPSLVKKTVAGRGRADKTQIAQMVKVILGLSEMPGEDATDALAVAITHAQASRMASLGPKPKAPRGRAKVGGRGR